MGNRQPTAFTVQHANLFRLSGQLKQVSASNWLQSTPLHRPSAWAAKGGGRSHGAGGVARWANFATRRLKNCCLIQHCPISCNYPCGWKLRRWIAAGRAQRCRADLFGHGVYQALPCLFIKERRKKLRNLLVRHLFHS